MKHTPLVNIAWLLAPVSLLSCGTYTPDKDPFSSDAIVQDGPDKGQSRQGQYENDIVIHVLCEIGEGLRLAQGLHISRLTEEWGTTVTQSITVEDQTGLAPGITATTPLANRIFTFPTGGNVTSPQSFSWSVGGSASANSLRTETIQYTFRNKDILKNTNPGCLRDNIKGVMIDGDLKIREFIYDKAQIWLAGNASLVGNGTSANQLNPFNTFTEEITFVAAYGGSFTPTWKLARISADASSNLIVGERTNTNDLIVTLGPVKTKNGKPIDYSTGSIPVQLEDYAVNQHQARVQAAAIAVSISGQSH